jgi:hypothetical protein
MSGKLADIGAVIVTVGGVSSGTASNAAPARPPDPLARRPRAPVVNSPKPTPASAA